MCNGTSTGSFLNHTLCLPVIFHFVKFINCKPHKMRKFYVKTILNLYIINNEDTDWGQTLVNMV